jgi:asparagine synthase (glutamine-hydrolysing)
MTIFAGAFSLDGHAALPAALCASLRQNVSRADEPTIDEVAAPGFYLVKVDVGAFGAPGLLRAADGSVTAVAGEPLAHAGEGVEGWDRAADVAALHAELAESRWQVLAGCRGTHCGVHYNAIERSLALFVDQAGVRPVYVWVGPQFVVFATALRILKAVPQVAKKFDVRGVAEIAAYSFPLGERTSFEGIWTLRAGEAMHVAKGRAERQPYMRWDRPQQQPFERAAAVDLCYDEFIGALKRRQRNAPMAAAFLSGGLDSRVIVGGLAAIGAEVHTVNYAPDDTQDQVFATMVAEQLGTVHTQVQTNADNVAQGYRKNAVAQWLASEFPATMAQRPTMMWSGDGGSVGLGHVYMTRPIVAALNGGDIAGALNLLNAGLPARIIAGPQRAAIATLSQRGAVEELAAIQGTDAGRRFHLFLMFNDQRRHLSAHFEDIDVERIEFQLPFFDARFLETILRAPSEPYLYHGFYIDWLAKFPNRLNTIPWQAYPGHVPCPVPAPAGLRYQWEDYYDKKMDRRMTMALVKRGAALMKEKDFPNHLISRSAMRLALLATASGLRDYRYLINIAATFCQHWRASDKAAAQ